MRDHTKLRAFELADQLALATYGCTSRFPREEQFGLTSQMRRAAVSVPSNIVEGKSRNTQKEFKHFLFIARGSAEELGYFLLLAKDLGYLDIKTFDELSDNCVHISSMLSSLISKIKNDL